MEVNRERNICIFHGFTDLCSYVHLFSLSHHALQGLEFHKKIIPFNKINKTILSIFDYSSSSQETMDVGSNQVDRH